MYRPLPGRGRRTMDDWRVGEADYLGCPGYTTHTRTYSSLLRRRAVLADASKRGLALPLPIAAAKRPGITAAGAATSSPATADMLYHGMPSTAFAGTQHTRRSAGGECLAGGIRRGGEGGGGGDRQPECDEKCKTGKGRGGDKERRRSTLKRLWQEAKHEKGYMGMAGVCLLVSSSMNLIAPTVIARVIDRASKRGRGDGSGGGGSESREVCVFGDSVSDTTFFLGAFGVFALGSLASWGRMYALAMASGGVAARLRTRLFEALMVQEKEFFDSNKAGELAPILAEDVDVASQVFADKMAGVLRSMNSSFNASLALLSISPSLTLVSISTVPIVGSVSMLYSKHVKRLSLKLRSVDSEAHAFATARMTNIRTVRAFANEKLETERFEEMVQNASKLRATEANAKGIFRGGLFALAGGALMAVFWVGGSRVGDGRMTAGQLSSFAVYTSMVGLGFAGLASGHADVSKGLASAERVFTLMDRVPAVALDEGLTPNERAVGNVEFKDVWFQYHGRDKGILRGVNLELSQGKVLALTGVSGAGKSTLASLVTRLYEPKQGCVMLDGTDVATLNPSWLRRQVGVVDQEPVLFDGSIADNIRYGVPGASDEDVQDAARQANAHDFIAQFPEGYNTKVGEQGRQLSGGEKQRVAIARAMLKDPPVLLLDEATSALDAESERLVTEAIDRLVASRTVLIIAHRQSTISKADYVAVLQDGEVAESGHYEELMARPDGLLVSLMNGEKLQP